MHAGRLRPTATPASAQRTSRSRGKGLTGGSRPRETCVPGKRIGSNAGVGVCTTRSSTRKDASPCRTKQDSTRQHKREGVEAHSKKPRSDQFRHRAALSQPKRRQLDEVAEVEDGVRSPRLRGAEVYELTLQLVLEETLGAASSDASQQAKAKSETLRSTWGGPASQHARRSTADIAAASRKSSTMSRSRKRQRRHPLQRLQKSSQNAAAARQDAKSLQTICK